ncbi:hypothetical protein MPL3356_60023 [Mesorhizobium plurifarium]|uniref:Uncharacterized protein n=1 Tax=Mesorhizobium plurifarium TaxID=69974 RepID=A0A090E7C3_MESPL|nr:hypothetical protein MPL3356_60023 [Mesorhizobium plurifarium]
MLDQLLDLWQKPLAGIRKHDTTADPLKQIQPGLSLKFSYPSADGALGEIEFFSRPGKILVTGSAFECLQVNDIRDQAPTHIYSISSST